MSNCPICNTEVRSSDAPILGAAIPKDDPTGQRVRLLGTFHGACWEAYVEHHPEGVEVVTCSECQGRGTTTVPGEEDRTDELVDCETCSGRGWVELSA